MSMAEGALTRTEQDELQQNESVIERNLGTFVEVGTALAAIRDARLYRADHATFEDYCRARWSLSRPRAYQLMDAADTAEEMSTIVDTPFITNEGQARAIASTLKEHGPEVAAQVLREAASDTLTAASITKVANELKRESRQEKQIHARARDERRLEDARNSAELGTTFDIRRGNFQDVLADVEDGSVDLVVTDPPYGDNFTQLYEDLAQWASAKLKPGGSLVAYVGQANLPDVLSVMGRHLRYWWTLALVHKHGAQQLPGKWVMIEWKPVVWFVKDHRSGRLYVADRMSGSKPRKDLHEWAQGVDEVSYLIEQLTDAGQLVVDPFAGSGSFGYAALELGRHFIGAENGSHEDAR
jgi:16S rRNA G966 N2-methylase RsmD